VSLWHPLACTIEADERMGADGKVVRKLNKAALTKELKRLKGENIERSRVSGELLRQSRAREGGGENRQAGATRYPVSLSYDVVPEMQEYERTITTVANSYVRPKVAAYVKNLERKLKAKMKDVKLHILRSDGGMASAKVAQSLPVNLLMSGPAGVYRVRFGSPSRRDLAIC
jgi:N-methylhydantoinase A